jgi:hypothetical protein
MRPSVINHACGTAAPRPIVALSPPAQQLDALPGTKYDATQQDLSSISPLRGSYRTAILYAYGAQVRECSAACSNQWPERVVTAPK